MLHSGEFSYALTGKRGRRILGAKGGIRMGYWIFMLVMVLLMPLVMLFTGRAFSKNAPKKINPVYGYRTAMSMKNQDTWQFAHRHFGKTWYVCGLVFTPLSVLGMLLVLGKDENAVGIAGTVLCTIQLLPLLLSIIPTERALRKTFDKDGNRR